MGNEMTDALQRIQALCGGCTDIAFTDLLSLYISEK
jgi:hypothetical protein